MKRKNNIFVTGSRGFIGSVLCNKLRKLNCKIGEIEYTQNDNHEIKSHNADIRTFDLDIMQNYEVLVHCATYGTRPNDNDFTTAYDINVKSLIRILDHIHKTNIRKIIIIGSCFEYGKTAEKFTNTPADAPLVPIGNYSLTKSFASLSSINWATINSFPLTILRPFQVYGMNESRHRFYKQLMECGKNNKNFHMSKGDQIRDFINVDLVTQRILEEVFDDRTQIAIQNIGTGIGTTLKDFAIKTWKLNGFNGKIISDKPKRNNELSRFVACKRRYVIASL